MAAAWHARLQQLDPGWLDLGLAVPLLDSSRAARELSWSPSVDATTVLRETLSGSVRLVGHRGLPFHEAIAVALVDVTLRRWADDLCPGRDCGRSRAGWCGRSSVS